MVLYASLLPVVIAEKVKTQRSVFDGGKKQ
jgi:hypothetical protein